MSCKITSPARKCRVELFGDGVDGGGEQSTGVGWRDDRDAALHERAACTLLLSFVGMRDVTVTYVRVMCRTLHNSVI